MGFTKALLVLSLVAVPAFGSVDLRIMRGGQRMVANISPILCYEERSCDDQPIRFRIEGGYNNTALNERIELVLNDAKSMVDKKDGELLIQAPTNSDVICVRTFDAKRSIPQHRTFCTSSQPGDDKCKVKYHYNAGELTLSFQCDNLSRVSNPTSDEKMDFEVTETTPIFCSTKIRKYNCD